MVQSPSKWDQPTSRLCQDINIDFDIEYLEKNLTKNGKKPMKDLWLPSGKLT